MTLLLRDLRSCRIRADSISIPTTESIQAHPCNVPLSRLLGFCFILYWPIARKAKRSAPPTNSLKRRQRQC